MTTSPTNPTLRSPVCWIGGKHYSAQRILRAFPPPKSYDTYVELFGGAAHVLIQKPPWYHIEVYNDVNDDLVNFWQQYQDHPQELEARCRAFLYARALYYQFHCSLFNGTPLEPLERAARWFYVQRSVFAGQPAAPVAHGWNTGAKGGHRSAAHAYQTALDLFRVLAQRFRTVMIDNRDFADVFALYDEPRVLFYVDPPYLSHEQYYRQDAATFTLADHRRLAALLNQTRAFVALSYYPDPSLLEDLYPAGKWYRITWPVAKHSQRTKTTHERATEMLLTNYRPARTLWDA